jgi:hypothetical protein
VAKWSTPPLPQWCRTTIRDKIGDLVLAWSIGTVTFATCRARSIPALECLSCTCPVRGFDETFEAGSVTGPKGVSRYDFLYAAALPRQRLPITVPLDSYSIGKAYG